MNVQRKIQTDARKSKQFGFRYQTAATRIITLSLSEA